MARLEQSRQRYQQRVDDCQRQLVVGRRNDEWFARARVATFLPAIGLAIYGCFWAAVGWPWMLAAGILVLIFIAVVRSHERLLRNLRETEQRLDMNETQLARVERRWDAISTIELPIPPEYQSVANDLDLFGPVSLYQLISLAHTPFGQDSLCNWLLTPATPSEIVERQQAVTCLAPMTELREDLDLRGRMLGASRDRTLAFVEWAESPPYLAARPWLTWSTRLLTIASVTAVTAAALGIVSTAVGFLAVVAVACFNLVLIALFAGQIHEVLGRVTSRSHDLRQYRPLLDAIARLPSEQPFFARLHARMGSTPGEPLAFLDGLTRIVDFANLRRDGLFGMPYYISQIFLLTDFHVVAGMENWQRRHGPHVRRWLEAIGQIEALSSLATLSHDNPDWVFPCVEASETSLTATHLGHPLLADNVRVSNDIVVGPPGTLVLVTGSNMSGKSTLLRAIGLNATLAQAGGPVCAAEFRLPPVELATCMRIRDSLADGVSFFMAELRRLKQIVDQSRYRPADHPQLLLYLLDEILQGTNSVERHIAVERVIGRLVESRAIGMVSTHDLELAKSPTWSHACQVVHFRESFTGSNGQQRMTFDYQLRSGISPTTNALKLLDFVGLND